jgi:hypothetical protein
LVQIHSVKFLWFHFRWEKESIECICIEFWLHVVVKLAYLGGVGLINDGVSIQEQHKGRAAIKNGCL